MNKVNLSYWLKTGYRNLKAKCLSLGDGVLLPFLSFWVNEKSSEREIFCLNCIHFRCALLVSWLRSFKLFIGVYKNSMKSPV